MQTSGTTAAGRPDGPSRFSQSQFLGAASRDHAPVFPGLQHAQYAASQHPLHLGPKPTDRCVPCSGAPARPQPGAGDTTCAPLASSAPQRDDMPGRTVPVQRRRRGRPPARVLTGPLAGLCLHGVTWQRDKHKWRASLSVRHPLYRKIHLGYFTSAEAAALAHDEAAIHAFGANAVLNFPASGAYLPDNASLKRHQPLQVPPAVAAGTAAGARLARIPSGAAQLHASGGPGQRAPSPHQQRQEAATPLIPELLRVPAPSSGALATPQLPHMALPQPQPQQAQQWDAAAAAATGAGRHAAAGACVAGMRQPHAPVGQHADAPQWQLPANPVVTLRISWHLDVLVQQQQDHGAAQLPPQPPPDAFPLAQLQLYEEQLSAERSQAWIEALLQP